MNRPDHIAADRLRLERLLDAPIDTVWRHLVDPELRARWFMGGPTDPRPSGAFTLTMQHDRLSDTAVPTPERYRQFIGHRWEERITRIEAPHLLAFSWDGADVGEVSFELSAEGGKTRLVLTHVGLRGPDDAIDFGGGWRAHLAALAHRLRGEGVPDFWALHAAAEAETRDALGLAA